MNKLVIESGDNSLTANGQKPVATVYALKDVILFYQTLMDFSNGVKGIRIRNKNF